MALTDNIVAYWNLNDNGSGGVSLVDSTGHGYTLTNNGGVTLGTGINGGGAVFNGTNNLSTTQTSPIVGTSSFSYSFWINVDSSTSGFSNILGTRTSAGSGAGEWAGLAENGGSEFNLVQFSGGFDISTGFVQTFNTTYFITIVNDETAGISSLYVDGNLFVTGTLPASLSAGFPINLGANGDYSQGLVGLIDEVGIWSRALTGTEVTDLYNGGNGLTYPFSSAYFNAAVNGSLSTLGNWWQDDAFTIPSVALPDSTDAVSISSAVTSGTATYASANITANIGSAVTITATITLTNAVNSGTLIGTTTLNGTASNAGTITGNAIVYYPAQNPLGGSVSGTITYFWPGGTGLWGGDVWIDGSLSFIIPDPSDVKAGVEYGPANNPYVGTYSGGGGSIQISRLLNLPWFIRI